MSAKILADNVVKLSVVLINGCIFAPTKKDNSIVVILSKAKKLMREILHYIQDDKIEKSTSIINH